jgi:hypothetical protein
LDLTHVSIVVRYDSISDAVSFLAGALGRGGDNAEDSGTAEWFTEAPPDSERAKDPPYIDMMAVMT